MVNATVCHAGIHCPAEAFYVMVNAAVHHVGALVNWLALSSFMPEPW